jgi:RNA polymerase sigma factor (sigma-70 family)
VHLGDRAVQQSDRDALVVEHLKFAGWYAKRYRDRGVPYVDLRQEARLALCQAANRFEPQTHGAKFVTYAAYWIRRALTEQVAAAERFPTPIEVLPGDLVGDDPEPSLDERAMTDLWDAINELPPRDRRILLRRYGLDGLRKWTVEESEIRFRMSAHLIRRSLLSSVNKLGLRLREIA